MRNAAPRRFVLAALVLLVSWAGINFLPGRSAGAATRAEDPAQDRERFIARLMGEELASSGAYQKVAWLSDRIGARLSGTPQAAQAIAWAVDEFRRDGFARAHVEKVMVPCWERGAIEARIVAPVSQPMAALALGMSVGTLAGGITAEVVEVDSLDALHAKGDAVRGRIVLFNRATRVDGSGAGYGENSPLRTRGPSEAAKQGAVATLVRSLGTLSARLPHTGTLVYAEDAPRIPAAAIAAEDAEKIHRLLQSGEPVRVSLALTCRLLPDAESGNVVADLRGTARPEEFVVLGAHLDSWDVGSGAIDDGAGVAIVMEALRLIKTMAPRPRRTLRVVLYMNEENGVRGGKAYAADHKEELERHVAAFEADSGAARPLGFSVNAGAGGTNLMLDLARPLAGLGADMVRAAEEGGTDVAPMRPAGVPTIGLRQDSTHYFDWHHTEADTLDKIDRDDLARSAVAMAYLAWALAESETTLPRLPPPTAAAGH